MDMAMNIPERLIGPAVLAAAFAANALHNHTALGRTLDVLPGFYPLFFFIGVGAILPALVLGRAIRRTPAAARALGVTVGWRDALAVVAALVVGAALAAAPLAPILGLPGGPDRVLTLFAQLMVASTAEVALFLGMTAVGLRAWLGGRDDWRTGLLMIVASSLLFGLFHFTYPTPWNTLATAATVGVVWLAVSTLFVLTRSLVAALLLDNVMATVGFATRDLTLPLPPTMAVAIAIFAIAAFVAAFAWARRSRGISPPGSANGAAGSQASG
jgi:hypothetical protein